MAFDRKHYKAVKKIMDWQINHVHFSLLDKCKNDPIGYAETFLPHISFCLHNEDYEGAKAVTDSIREFAQRFTKAKMSELLLKVPEYAESEKIRGILCLGKADDISGMASGGIEWT